MTVSLRTPRSSDASDVARLTAELGYPADASSTAARLARILAEPNQRFLVAEADGSVVVGWVHAAVCEFVEMGTVVVIGGLVVDRSLRRRGIGRKLMGAAEEWAVQHGCGVIRLWSSTGRTEAHRFYERLGYSSIKTQHAFAKSLDPTGLQEFGDLVPRIDE